MTLSRIHRTGAIFLVATMITMLFGVGLSAPRVYATSSFTNSTTGLGSNLVYGVYAVGSTVYAATSGGLSISTNSGTSFTNRTTSQGLGHNTVRAVYVVGSTVYAATDRGLSISTNSGTSFTNYLASRNVLGVYAAGSTVYAAHSVGLSISTNSGASFTDRGTRDGLGNDRVNSVYAVGNTVYAATSGGLSISTNSGTSFTNRTTSQGLGHNTVRAVYVVGSTVYAATDGGLSISTNGGSSFTNYTTSDGLGSNSVNGVYAVDGTVYAATLGGLSISTNGGSSFTNYTTSDGLGFNNTWGVYADGGNVYVATSIGVSVSSNPALTPTFETPVMRTSDGFTVNVTNYDAAFTWTATVGSGSVSVGAASGSVLPLTVSGLSAGASATLTVTTTRSGYPNGTATVTGEAKSSQTVTWAPTTAVTTVQSPLTPSTPATALGGATISYSLVSHTTDTCSVDMNSGVVTYAGTGNCVVRATAQATSDYAEGTEDVTFVVSKATQAVNWSPATSITTTQSPLTPSSATALGGAAISYSKISNTTATCSVDPTSGQLTYTGAGKCVVRASAEATDDYESGFADVEFTVSKATPTFTWNPSLTYDVPDGSTTFPAATTNSDGTVSYALTSNGAGCSLSGRTLSFTQEGSCTVTASVTATDTYEAVSSVKAFAVSKAAQPVSWSPSASLTLVNLSASLGAASTSGDGSITYSATSSGSENCRFPDNTSPVLHYDAAGSCTVVATAGATTGYAQGTQSAVITISLATPTTSWSPVTALTMPAATVTPTAATTTGDGAVTYARTSGTNCTVDTNTGAITYTAAGQCQITATSQATSRYTAGSTAATFTVSLASQTITAAASSTTLRPRGTTTVSSSGSTGSGTITWTNTTPAICTLTGTTVTADADGSCILTVDIDADTTYAAASDTITITVRTPPPPPAAGGGSGGASSSGGGSSNGSGNSAGGADSGGSGSTEGGSTASNGQAESNDGTPVPGAGSTTRGRALPPPPEDIEVRPLRAGERSSVLIKQPTGAAGARVLSTVVVVRNSAGRVISRVNVALRNGQADVEVTVPYVADGYTVDVYNVNEVGVSTGALTRSPLVRATTITKRTSSGQPRLFGQMLGKPIIFNGGSAVLDKSDKKQLRAIARQAMASNERLFVTGFARKGGGSASELASLSTKRARAAATYLSKRGVRVWIRYWGAGSLNGSGATSDRRVEIRTSARPIPRTLVP